ncbi:MAG: hypothetical protein ABJP66_00140 [Hyphomicrobiales bacterium]
MIQKTDAGDPASRRLRGLVDGIYGRRARAAETFYILDDAGRASRRAGTVGFDCDTDGLTAAAQEGGGGVAPWGVLSR